MAEIIDISVPLRSKMPIWPGSVGLHLWPTMRLEAGDSANISRLDCDLHVGTHVDAPRHFIENGDSVEQLSLDTMIGLAVVAYLPGVNSVTTDDLIGLQLSSDVKRLLLRTHNSELWAAGVTEYRKDYVALTVDGARWVVEQGIRLIGVDYLSVQRFDDSALTHRVLLEAGVIILEGLNLTGVQPGTYELFCLPLNLVGAEGAPARVVLRSLPTLQEHL